MCEAFEIFPSLLPIPLGRKKEKQTTKKDSPTKLPPPGFEPGKNNKVLVIMIIYSPELLC